MSEPSGQPAAPHELVERALRLPGADDRIVIVQATHSANLRWANNTLTTNGVAGDCTVTAITFLRRGEGVAVAARSGTAVTHDQVAALVAMADAAASVSPVATDDSPLVADLTDQEWTHAPATTGIEAYADLAPGLGEAFGTASAEGRVLYGFVDHEVTTTYLGSTRGLRRRHVQPTGHWGCTGKSGGSSAWVGGSTRDFTDVAAADMDGALKQRLAWASRSIDLPPGRYDTVLPPTAVADLLIYAYWCAGDRAARDAQSVFGRPGHGPRTGERLSPHAVTLFSDPAHPGLEACPFQVVTSGNEDASLFDNGHQLGRTDWVHQGVLRDLVRTRHAASTHEVTPRGAIDNLVLHDQAGQGDTMDLVADVERGLLLTCLWYIREVDAQTLLLTGLTRDGVYLVEGGEITAEVNNFRFNESPIALLGRYQAAGVTVPTFSREWGDYFPRTQMPALRVPDFHMSTVSQAR